MNLLFASGLALTAIAISLLVAMYVLADERFGDDEVGAKAQAVMLCCLLAGMGAFLIGL